MFVQVNVANKPRPHSFGKLQEDLAFPASAKHACPKLEGEGHACGVANDMHVMEEREGLICDTS